MIQSETEGTTKQKEKDDNKKELGQRLEADIKTYEKRLYDSLSVGLYLIFFNRDSVIVSDLFNTKTVIKET